MRRAPSVRHSGTGEILLLRCFGHDGKVNKDWWVNIARYLLS